jgi:hypothetical protein
MDVVQVRDEDSGRDADSGSDEASEPGSDAAQVWELALVAELV